MRKRFFYLFFKRLFDVLFSFFLLIFFSPFFLLISLLILFFDNGPVLYVSYRTGKDNIPFKFYKFRTMILNADKIGGCSTAFNDFRLTKYGRIFRKYKIDELPQLYNILIGDMSFVGPRPQVPFYTNLYSERELLILSMRPGLTDFSTLYFLDMDSILGQSDVDKKYFSEIEPKKNLLRLKYVENSGFFTDILILFKTLLSLLKVSC